MLHDRGTLPENESDGRISRRRRKGRKAPPKFGVEQSHPKSLIRKSDAMRKDPAPTPLIDAVVELDLLFEPTALSKLTSQEIGG